MTLRATPGATLEYQTIVRRTLWAAWAIGPFHLGNDFGTAVIAHRLAWGLAMPLTPAAPDFDPVLHPLPAVDALRHHGARVVWLEAQPLGPNLALAQIPAVIPQREGERPRHADQIAVAHGGIALRRTMAAIGASFDTCFFI